MAQEKKRFAFDDSDTIEISKKELHSSMNKIEKSTTSSSKPEAKKASTTKGKKGKKKLKLKKRYIVLLVFVLVVGGGLLYIVNSGGNDGPVYGDRCAQLLSLDTDKFGGIEQEIAADPAIESIKIDVDCRIIKFTIKYVEGTSEESAIALATNAIRHFDNSMGATKDEGSEFSQIFGYANGRGQYNAEFYMTSSNNESFPIFGTKHPSSDELSFTGTSVKDQETKDTVTSDSEEE